ncbi:MAG: cytochrome c peroxidase [Rheinheimera sp.]|nr:cytochrome c peroxidase [Rheinheimera sp.]
MTKPVMSVTAGRLFALSSFTLCSLLFSAAAAAEQFQLQSSCPASFEQVVDEQGASRCKLVSRYQAYDSLQNKGVGGTQTALPTVRDGFSPEQIDLGRFLFFDPLFSGNHRQACASCHQPGEGLCRW